MGLTAKQRALKEQRAAERAAAEAQAAAARRPIVETAALLARCLDETEYGPRLQLLRSVRLLGPALALELLAEVTRIEQSGGELIENRTCYRTPGGIFFRQVRDLCTPEEWARIAAGCAITKEV